MFELHTSDFDPCPLRASLRRGGNFDGTAGTALVRGLIVHSVLELIHRHSDSNRLEALLKLATMNTMTQLEEEGRMPSDSVTNNIESICMDVYKISELYRERVYPITKKWTLLGCEVPVYWQLRDDIHLSSHLDALFINEEGRPIVWDWKWREAAQASMSDLSRSMQLACYFALLSSCDGLMQLDKQPDGWGDNGDGWYHMVGGMPVPKVAWVALPSLKPYSRQTTTMDDEGKRVVFPRGADRPLSRVIRYINFLASEENIEKIKAAAIGRADLLMGDCVPANPQGCSHCECEAWCPRFDMAEVS